MNDIGNWIRSQLLRMSAGVQRFMVGRYGTDKLNMVILCVGFAASLLSSFVRGSLLSGIAWIISYALMIWAIFRTLSRNTHKRYQENRRFLLLLDRFKDRQNRYFICPRCHQTVRVPRHKGKIAITCPKCRERFERRT